MEPQHITPKWRPRASLRVIVIGLILRGDNLLAAAVTHDDGRIKGWRPLGGGVEFGETAAAALARELDEELGATIGPARRIGVLENLFTHHGDPGHEIVMVLRTDFINPGLAAADQFLLSDGGHRSEVAWVPMRDFLSGHAVLFPDGLVDLLQTQDTPR